MNSNLKKCVSECLSKEYEQSIPEIEEHHFSENFERKMKGLLFRTKLKKLASVLNKASKIAACLVVAVMTFLLCNDFGLDSEPYPVAGIYIQYERENMVFQLNYEREPRPIDFIPEEYEVTYDLSQFGLRPLNIQIDLDFGSSRKYRKYISYQIDEGGPYFSFSQLDRYTRRKIYVGYIADIELMQVGGNTAVYFIDCGHHSLWWVNGDYVYHVRGSMNKITKDEMILIAESVKKVEK